MEVAPKRKAGRPKGSLNKATLRAQAEIEEEVTLVSADSATLEPVEEEVEANTETEEAPRSTRSTSST
jgi:hypothetical protein